MLSPHFIQQFLITNWNLGFFRSWNFVFLNKNCTQKYKFLVIGKQDKYFVRHNSNSQNKYSEADIKGMIGFLVDNHIPSIRWHSYGH
jgi:hypothetical protein